MPIVHMTREITSENLVRTHRALGVSLLGSATVKISTGEPGGHNFLQPELIRNLVQEPMGIIAERNTACEGRRDTSKAHWETMWDHGFTAIVSCDILDEEGHTPLLVTGGHHPTENHVGFHLQNCDSMLMLSHFKGHAMGGFGGALKNMSIGLASSYGRIWIHPPGTSTRFEDVFTADRGSFLESMADVGHSVVDYMSRENIVYTSVANRLSVDHDCDARPHDPEMGDIGIFAFADPVVLDQTCVDAAYAFENDGKVVLIEYMESRNGIHTVEAAHSLGLGSRRYGPRCIGLYKN